MRTSAKHEIVWWSETHLQGMNNVAFTKKKANLSFEMQ